MTSPDNEQELRRLRKRLREARAEIASLREEVKRERQAKQELRQRVMERGWRPGYAQNPEYEATRLRFFEHCLERGKLPESGHVLDVGCGIGGVAQHLAAYLSEEGRYHGFDVDPRAIKVANETVAFANPNFRFELADVWNSKYNPEGPSRPEEYRFPFGDDEFDLIILRSVFTHMLPDEVTNYLGEIARTLKPGGRALVTYFLLDEEARHLMEEDELGTEFPFDKGIYWLADEEVPEVAVLYEQDWVFDRYRDLGLEVPEPTLYGSWRWADIDSTDGQDLVTAAKPG